MLDGCIYICLRVCILLWSQLQCLSNCFSFPGPSTPDAATAAYQRSGQSAYLSPVNNNNSTLYSAHQQQNSPYQTAGLHQTPAPLPPGVGARSPYIPTGNPPTAGSDLNHTGGGAASGVGGGMKRTGLPPHPVEAPGAYEPSVRMMRVVMQRVTLLCTFSSLLIPFLRALSLQPRFHLGGQSPNKRARYLSSASNSSVSTGSSVAVDALVGAANRNGVESYLEHSSNFGHSTGSRALHGTSPNGSHNNYSSSRSQSVMGAAAEHPVRMTSPFYPGHYEGLEMRSPAPPPVTTHGRSFPGNAPEQQQLPKPPAMVRAPLEPSVWTVRFIVIYRMHYNSNHPRTCYYTASGQQATCANFMIDDIMVQTLQGFPDASMELFSRQTNIV